MTDQPSEAALRKACEVLGYEYPCHRTMLNQVINLARHFDAGDKAARDALGTRIDESGQFYRLAEFARRHILPANPVTVADVVERWRIMPGRTSESLSAMLRDAGLLREDG